MYVVVFHAHAREVMKIKTKLIVEFMGIILFFSSFPSTLVISETRFSSYRIFPFWDETTEYLYHAQEGNLSCGPASIQMVLHYYDIHPLLTQSQIAAEMNKTIYQITFMSDFDDFFENHNITVIFCRVLRENFNESVNKFKESISQNRPIIVLMNYSISAESPGHFRVITGYNQTGFFMHDPSYQEPYLGPNLFFNYSLFETLRKARGNWITVLEEKPIEPSIIIVEGGVSNEKTIIGKSENVWYRAEYGFSFESFDNSTGNLLMNREPMMWSSINKRWERELAIDKPISLTLEITGVNDEKYGITLFDDRVGPLSILWKRRTVFGFPIESVAIGLIFVILVIWIQRARIIEKTCTRARDSLVE